MSDLLPVLLKKFRNARIKLHTLLMRPRFHALDSHVNPHVDFTNPQYISIGKNVQIRPFTWIYAITDDHHRRGVFSPSISIKDGCDIGRFCHITCSNQLIIEENVFISERVLITDSIHDYEDTDTPILWQQLVSRGPVIIGRGTWIGDGAQIVGKVNIGKNVVISANCFVNRDVPDYCVVAGVPFHIVKRFDPVQSRWIRVDE